MIARGGGACDVVVTAATLPDVDGYEVCCVLQEYLPATPVILLCDPVLLATGTDLVARARRLRRRQVAPPCPRCGSDRVVPIVYGAARLELISAYATGRVGAGRSAEIGGRAHLAVPRLRLPLEHVGPPPSPRTP